MLLTLLQMLLLLAMPLPILATSRARQIQWAPWSRPAEYRRWCGELLQRHSNGGHALPPRA